LDSVGTNHILQQYFNSSQDTQVLQHKPLGPFRNLRGVNHRENVEARGQFSNVTLVNKILLEKDKQIQFGINLFY